MATRSRATRSEESQVASILEVLFPESHVSLHDDGSQPGLYDLAVDGEVEAAVEVGLQTDGALRAAQDHWLRHLQAFETEELRLYWFFHFAAAPRSDDSPTRFPRVAKPDPDLLVPLLKRLENRGISEIGQRWQYYERHPGGKLVIDPDIEELFDLLGDEVIQGAKGADWAAIGRPGGWYFGYQYGGAVATDPNQLPKFLEAKLNGPSLADLRRKLRKSERQKRIAAIVFDGSTSFGWGFTHWGPNSVPSDPVRLPSEVTELLVVGPEGVVLTFTTHKGWRRVSLPPDSQVRSPH